VVWKVGHGYVVLHPFQLNYSYLVIRRSIICAVEGSDKLSESNGREIVGGEGAVAYLMDSITSIVVIIIIIILLLLLFQM
jgi:hypothetical protein